MGVTDFLGSRLKVAQGIEPRRRPPQPGCPKTKDHLEEWIGGVNGDFSKSRRTVAVTDRPRERRRFLARGILL
jgi:hypothetical protein